MTNLLPRKKWGILGAGKLASCFLRGWIASGAFSEDDFIVSCRSEESRARLLQEWPNLQVTFENTEVVRNARSVLLGVKPYDLEKLLETLSVDFQDKTLVLSLAAGFDRAQIVRALSGRDDLRVGRLMANTAVAFNKGLMGLDSQSAPSVTEEEKRQFELLGAVHVIEESRFDEFTVASASAPAFVLCFEEALAKAIAEMGFERSVTRSLTLSLLDSTRHQLVEDFSPDRWVQQIATPGGMTAEGVNVMQGRDIESLVSAAFKASLKKSKGLT